MSALGEKRGASVFATSTEVKERNVLSSKRDLNRGPSDY